MARISAFIIGDLNGFVLTQTKNITKIRKGHTRALALESQKIIRRIITSKIQRPGSTGRLAKFVGDVEFLSNGEAGVGNIDVLNVRVKYWHWQNFGVAQTGRKRPPKSVGFFSPGNPQPNAGSFQEGRFVQSSDGFLLTPGKDVPAMNYIEGTLGEINSQAGAILSRTTVRV